MEAGCKNIPQPQKYALGSNADRSFGLFRGSIFERKEICSRLAWNLWKGMTVMSMSPQNSMWSPF